VISTLYAAAARRRRERYARNPWLRRRLRRPVISVGNLAIGGRGKTPIAACIARLLRDAGERPAILSRGYGREQPADGVVIVRDADGIRADLPRAGDEPLMLARQLPGVSVLVCEDRYLAGRLAEHHLGATVHILDDGLQHLQLDRDVEIVIVGRDDLERPVTLPRGRLREPLDTLIVADAILTEPGVVIDTAGIVARVFTVKRTIGPPVVPGCAAGGDRPCPTGPAFAVAGIASPGAFFAQLESMGFRPAGRMAFRDHHRFSSRDIARIAAAARAAGAASIVTTEKDYVRLLRFRPFPLPVAVVPLTMEPEPLPDFTAWLAASLREARDLPGD
jgi:tetraacyldisaccharide 4'-kinase